MKESSNWLKIRNWFKNYASIQVPGVSNNLDHTTNEDKLKEYEMEIYYKKFQLNDRVLAKKRNRIYFLKINSIAFIRSSGDYTEIFYFNGEKYIITKTMEEWISRLPKDNFCRTHKSFIINIDFIQKVVKVSPDTAIIYLKDYNEPIKISRFYFKKLKEVYT